MSEVFDECIIHSEVKTESDTFSEDSGIKAKVEFSQAVFLEYPGSHLHWAFSFLLVESNFEPWMVERCLYKSMSTTTIALGKPQSRPDKNEYW